MGKRFCQYLNGTAGIAIQCVLINPLIVLKYLRRITPRTRYLCLVLCDSVPAYWLTALTCATHPPRKWISACANPLVEWWRLISGFLSPDFDALIIRLYICWEILTLTILKIGTKLIISLTIRIIIFLTLQLNIYTPMYRHIIYVYNNDKNIWLAFLCFITLCYSFNWLLRYVFKYITFFTLPLLVLPFTLSQ